MEAIDTARQQGNGVAIVAARLKAMRSFGVLAVIVVCTDVGTFWVPSLFDVPLDVDIFVCCALRQTPPGLALSLV